MKSTFLIHFLNIFIQKALRTSGIRMNDLRIKEMMENLRKVHRLSNSEGGTPETQKLNRDTFKS